MCQPNVHVLQPCPVIPCGSALITEEHSLFRVYPSGNQVTTTLSLEPLNSSRLVQMAIGWPQVITLANHHQIFQVTSQQILPLSPLVISQQKRCQIMTLCYLLNISLAQIIHLVFSECEFIIFRNCFIHQEAKLQLFQKKGMKKYRWNFVHAANQNYVCSSNTHDSSHV